MHNPLRWRWPWSSAFGLAVDVVDGAEAGKRRRPWRFTGIGTPQVIKRAC